MPTLEWIGKSKVVNHHQEVPFRVLERQYSFDEMGKHTEDNGSDNMIIHGDNLEALKALLPQYEGRVKCIYIDPPYNTGNEKWCYNDNVNDPHIQKWLGEVVGKEGEDLTRHDKWLCMMYPRLMLLQKLLADDGAIFISIDDNELYNLKFICDEIFGASCFVSNISWQRTYSTRNDSKGIVNEVEHILVYSKQPGWNPNKLSRTEEMNARYSNPDNDVCAWKSTDAFAPGATTHQGMVYAIQNPFTGVLLYPSNGRCWSLGQDQMFEIMSQWGEYELREIADAQKRASICGVSEAQVKSGVKAIMLSDSVEDAAQKAAAIYNRGQWPLFYFGQGGKGGIRRKTKVIGRISLWLESVQNDATSEAQEQHIKKIEERLNEIDGALNRDSVEERKQSALSRIQQYMTKWAEELQLEHSDSPYRLDLNKMTVVVDKSDRPVPLKQLGSGSNWVGVHLITYFALQYYFIESNRPVPRFLFLDQPSQVYFPSELDEQKIDEDEVNKMYKFIIDRTEELHGQLQVIVVDHTAGEEDQSHQFVTESWWKDDKKLIPDDWYEPNEALIPVS